MTKNPWHFENFGINYINFVVNGESVPNQPFKPNFNEGDYLRLYHNLHDSVGITFSNAGKYIKRYFHTMQVNILDLI